MTGWPAIKSAPTTHSSGCRRRSAAHLAPSATLCRRAAHGGVPQDASLPRESPWGCGRGCGAARGTANGPFPSLQRPPRRGDLMPLHGLSILPGARARSRIGSTQSATGGGKMPARPMNARRSSTACAMIARSGSTAGGSPSQRTLPPTEY